MHLSTFQRNASARGGTDVASVVAPTAKTASGHQFVPVPALLLLLAFLCGCGSKGEDTAESSSPGADAYAAARVLVGKSIASPATTRISALDEELSTGAMRQSDGNWKTWGWLEISDTNGKVVHEEWRAVMSPVAGAGRKWRALWLEVGGQQSGDPTAWRKEALTNTEQKDANAR